MACFGVCTAVLIRTVHTCPERSSQITEPSTVRRKYRWLKGPVPALRSYNDVGFSMDRGRDSDIRVDASETWLSGTIWSYDFGSSVEHLEVLCWQLTVGEWQTRRRRRSQLWKLTADCMGMCNRWRSKQDRISQRYLEKYRAALTRTTYARTVEDRKGKRTRINKWTPQREWLFQMTHMGSIEE